MTSVKRAVVLLLLLAAAAALFASMQFSDLASASRRPQPGRMSSSSRSIPSAPIAWGAG
jgi:hypothetical protein